MAYWDFLSSFSFLKKSSESGASAVRERGCYSTSINTENQGDSRHSRQSRNRNETDSSAKHCANHPANCEKSKRHISKELGSSGSIRSPQHRDCQGYGSPRIKLEPCDDDIHLGQAESQAQRFQEDDPASARDARMALDDLPHELEVSACQDQFLDIDDPQARDWSLDEIWLFNKLSSRGMEPLLPELWQWDFPSFPDSLFSRTSSEVYIQNLNTTVIEAARELDCLIQAGPRCRDALRLGQKAQRPLCRGINRYLNWISRDGRVQRNHIDSIIAMTVSRPKESTAEAVQRLTLSFASRVQQWECQISQARATSSAAIALPSLFGFFIKHSVLAILSYNANATDPFPRTLLVMDYQEVGQDVWHALAIAIVCVKAREILLLMGQLDLLQGDVHESSDPDA